MMHLRLVCNLVVCLRWRPPSSPHRLRPYGHTLSVEAIMRRRLGAVHRQLINIPSVLFLSRSSLLDGCEARRLSSTMRVTSSETGDYVQWCQWVRVS